MTEALTRVIEEQQKRIDDLLKGNKVLIDRSANVFKKNEKLFEAFARLLDADVNREPTEKEFQKYHKLRNECRHLMWEAGYCLHCYEFICTCEGLD